MGGISEDEGSCFKVSSIDFKVSDTSLSISGSWRSRTENQLLLNSGGAQFTCCMVQNPQGLCYRGLHCPFGIHFSYVSSSQPILELLLNLPIIHVMNVEAAFTVLCPVSSLSTVSAHIWEGLHLPCCIDIHGNWIAWCGGRVCKGRTPLEDVEVFEIEEVEVNVT